MAGVQWPRGVRGMWISGVTVFLLGAAACGDEPFTPSTLAGQYTLAQAGGQPLPGAVFDGIIHDSSGTIPDFHLRIVASSGSLTLTADGRYQHAVDLVATIDGAPHSMPRWRDHGQFTLQGDSVHFDSEFLQGVQFAGAAKAGRLEVEQDLPGEGRLARYAFARQ
jgi:hypothetical protein